MLCSIYYKCHVTALAKQCSNLFDFLRSSSISLGFFVFYYQINTCTHGFPSLPPVPCGHATYLAYILHHTWRHANQHSQAASAAPQHSVARACYYMIIHGMAGCLLLHAASYVRQHTYHKYMHACVRLVASLGVEVPSYYMHVCMFLFKMCVDWFLKIRKLFVYLLVLWQLLEQEVRYLAWHYSICFIL